MKLFRLVCLMLAVSVCSIAHAKDTMKCVLSESEMAEVLERGRFPTATVSSSYDTSDTRNWKLLSQITTRYKLSSDGDVEVLHQITHNLVDDTLIQGWVSEREWVTAVDGDLYRISAADAKGMRFPNGLRLGSLMTALGDVKSKPGDFEAQEGESADCNYLMAVKMKKEALALIPNLLNASPVKSHIMTIRNRRVVTRTDTLDEAGVVVQTRYFYGDGYGAGIVVPRGGTRITARELQAELDGE